MSKPDRNVTPLPQARRSKGGCPICRKPSSTRYRPFCSARCADIDLGRWFNGAYRVPTDEAPAAGDLTGGEAQADEENGS